MFELSFSYASATPLPPNLSIDNALATLHDFETVIKLSPDCRGCKRILPSKNSHPKTNGVSRGTGGEMQYYEVDEDLPFIPKKLWSGGVKYTADFLPVADGCDITIHAPAGFTSTNHWRILRNTAPISSVSTAKNNDSQYSETIPEDEMQAALERVGTKDLLHAETDTSGSGWYVQIISDAKCPRPYAGFVEGFLKNSHAQLQHAFIDRLKTQSKAKRPQPVKRSTLSRRRSSVL